MNPGFGITGWVTRASYFISLGFISLQSRDNNHTIRLPWSFHDRTNRAWPAPQWAFNQYQIDQHLGITSNLNPVSGPKQVLNACWSNGRRGRRGRWELVARPWRVEVAAIFKASQMKLLILTIFHSLYNISRFFILQFNMNKRKLTHN